ncbi:MAG: glutamyl-tRNA reductase [Thermoguttaceae bacterium]|nr:glutamyl-tRNA reductase [Planctomycetaceae bacterium]MBQ4144134.1 glutamyl-tRNA reductase [Thermoguttaceae bacterium]
MIWLAVGCRYREAGVSMREKLAFSEAQIREALGLLRARYPELETVILSTCNRVELYAALELGLNEETADTPAELSPHTNAHTNAHTKNADSAAFPKAPEAGLETLLKFWAELKGQDLEAVKRECFQLTGAKAIHHLFMVASSLDSMIVGEGQIGGQVQSAYNLAVECGSVGPLLHSAFQRAGNIARKVTAETAIHQYRTSVPSVAVSCFARQIFEHFESKHTLVIGAGKMAEETLLYLRDEGVKTVTIVNRNIEKAQRMAEQFQGNVRPWEELDAALTEADLVVSITGAMEPIVTLERFRKLEDQRNFRPLFVLDLAVPRDFDPRLAQLENVYLYSVDDLQSVCDANQAARERDLPAAQKIVSEQLHAFLLDIRHRKSGRVISELRQYWDQPKEKELERLFRKLPDLTDAEKREIEYSFDRLVNKLLHQPLTSLHEAGENPENQRGLLKAVRKLFRLD